MTPAPRRENAGRDTPSLSSNENDGWRNALASGVVVRRKSGRARIVYTRTQRARSWRATTVALAVVQRDDSARSVGARARDRSNPRPAPRPYKCDHGVPAVYFIYFIPRAFIISFAPADSVPCPRLNIFGQAKIIIDNIIIYTITKTICDMFYKINFYTPD